MCALVLVSVCVGGGPAFTCRESKSNADNEQRRCDGTTNQTAAKILANGNSNVIPTRTDTQEQRAAKLQLFTIKQQYYYIDAHSYIPHHTTPHRAHNTLCFIIFFFFLFDSSPLLCARTLHDCRCINIHTIFVYSMRRSINRGIFGLAGFWI